MNWWLVIAILGGLCSERIQRGFRAPLRIIEYYLLERYGFYLLLRIWHFNRVIGEGLKLGLLCASQAAAWIDCQISFLP